MEVGKQIYGNKINALLIKRLFLALTILFLNILPITSQVISGHIKNKENQGLEYVNIGIVGTSKGTISNNEGFFNIDVSKYKDTDSLYFSHLSYKKKTKSIQDIKKSEVITLEIKNIEIPEVVVNLKKKKTIIRKFGIRIPTLSSYTSVDYFNEYKKKEIAETGVFLSLKKDYLATDFELKILSNSCEKVIFRLNFYLSDDQKKNLTPLIEKPIYVEVDKNEKSFIISKKINIMLPKGKIWVGMQAVDIQGEKEDIFCVPITFSEGWIRIENNFEKFPIGGFPIRIKGYKLDEK